jgi:hypothetical protein
MKIAAGCTAMLIAAVLVGGAFMDYRDDEAASRRIEVHASGATFTMYDETTELVARKKAEKIRGVAGVAFLVAGLFIFGTRKKKPAPTPAA